MLGELQYRMHIVMEEMNYEELLNENPYLFMLKAIDVVLGDRPDTDKERTEKVKSVSLIVLYLMHNKDITKVQAKALTELIKYYLVEWDKGED